MKPVHKIQIQKMDDQRDNLVNKIRTQSRLLQTMYLRKTEEKCCSYNTTVSRELIGKMPSKRTYLNFS